MVSANVTPVYYCPLFLSCHMNFVNLRNPFSSHSQLFRTVSHGQSASRQSCMSCKTSTALKERNWTDSSTQRLVKYKYCTSALSVSLFSLPCSLHLNLGVAGATRQGYSHFPACPCAAEPSLCGLQRIKVRDVISSPHGQREMGSSAFFSEHQLSIVASLPVFPLALITVLYCCMRLRYLSIS